MERASSLSRLIQWGWGGFLPQRSRVRQVNGPLPNPRMQPLPLDTLMQREILGGGMGIVVRAEPAERRQREISVTDGCLSEHFYAVVWTGQDEYSERLLAGCMRERTDVRFILAVLLRAVAGVVVFAVDPVADALLRHVT